ARRLEVACGLGTGMGDMLKVALKAPALAPARARAGYAQIAGQGHGTQSAAAPARTTRSYFAVGTLVVLLAAGIVGAARLGVNDRSQAIPTPTPTAQVTISVPTAEAYTPNTRRTVLPDRRDPVQQPVPFPFVTAVGPTPCE